MNLSFRQMTLGLLALCTAGLSPAATYYVDPATGSMSNPGTSSSPWSTLQAVFSAGKTFVTGDVINLRNGFHGSPTVTGNFASGNVTIQAQSGHTPKLRILAFNNARRWIVTGLDISPRNAGVYDNSVIVDIPSNSSFITLDNCTIYHAENVNGWGHADFLPRMGRGIHCYGPDCTFTNNHLQNTRWSLTVEPTAARAIVRYNLIEDVLTDGIRALGNNGVYEYNTLRNWYGIDGSAQYQIDSHDDAFQVWTVPVDQGTVTGIVIRGNTIINSTDSNKPWQAHNDGLGSYRIVGIGMFDNGLKSNTVVENNVIIVDNTGHGIALHNATNSRIVNNTVIRNSFGNGPSHPWVTFWGGSSSGNVLNNNISGRAPTAQYAVNGASQSMNTITTNYTAYFVAYAGQDLHLKSGSPAIDAGTTASAPSIDRDGVTRTAPYDRGAYEFVSATAPAAPSGLTATTIDYQQINLSWTDQSNNETGFKIERKKGSTGTYAQIATVGAVGGTGSAGTYQDTSVGSGKTYYYRVRAYNAVGNSAFSNEANATTDEVASGRMGHWNLNEGTGTTTADASGNGNTGNLGASPANPAWTTAGKIGNALDFDGVDDVVNAGTGATLDNLTAVTVTAWISADTLGEGAKGRIVVKGAGVAPTAGWHFHVTLTNQLNFQVDYSTTDMQRISATNAMSLGAWRHVVATWTGSATATNVKFYVDGVETGYSTTTNGAGTRVDDAASSQYLGNESGGTRTFDGKLDDVRVYNRVLSVSEITAIHRAGL